MPKSSSPGSPEPEEPVKVAHPRRVIILSMHLSSCSKLLTYLPQALTRRVNAGVPVVIGLDDPSSILDTTPDVSTPQSPPPDPAVADVAVSVVRNTM